jgi:hypothetical protein
MLQGILRMFETETSRENREFFEREAAGIELDPAIHQWHKDYYGKAYLTALQREMDRIGHDTNSFLDGHRSWFLDKAVMYRRELKELYGVIVPPYVPFDASKSSTCVAINWSSEDVNRMLLDSLQALVKKEYIKPFVESK